MQRIIVIHLQQTTPKSVPPAGVVVVLGSNSKGTLTSYIAVGDKESALSQYLILKEGLARAQNANTKSRSLDYYSSKLGDFAGAIEIYEQAIKADPDNALAQQSLGKAYFETHYYLKAAEHYQQAIRLQPDNGVAHYELASAYLMLGDKDSALAEQKSLQDLVRKTDDYLLKRSYRSRVDELLKKIQE
jgi:tetratricopeptide (TPR) repeat protein